MDEGVYIADVGFGEGSVDPVRLVPGEFISNGFKFCLTQEDDDWWRMHKFLPNARRSFDFTLRTADENCFAQQCTSLQTASDSPFVLNLMCYRHFEGGYFNLVGRVLKKVESTDNVENVKVSERLLQNEEDLLTTLRDDFGVDVP